MSARPAKLLWWLALTVLAAIVMFAQIDRLSRYSPPAAALVPDQFLSFGQGHIAAATLRNGTSAQALDEAQTLITRRPLPAKHQAILAAAQAKSGASKQSRSSFQLAAQRGWREPAIQTTLLELAIVAEDGPEAARRFAALLATDGNDEALRATAQRVFALPDAQKEMARLLANDPRWQERFKRLGPQLLSDQIYFEITR